MASDPPLAPCLPTTIMAVPSTSKPPSQFDLSLIKSDPQIYEKALSEVISREIQSGRDRATVFTVKFEVACKVEFGQGVRVVGDHWKLGQWNPRKALVLSWTPGDVWVGELVFEDLHNKRLEFKYLLVEKHRKMRWEEGFNHVIQLATGGELRRGKVYHVLRSVWTPK